MSLEKRLFRAAQSEGFRLKLSGMVTEFFQEAAVLVAVLGILDATIARGAPTMRVLAWSLGIGAVLFACGCIIQLSEFRDDGPSTEEELNERDD